MHDDTIIAMCPDCGKEFPPKAISISKEKLILAEDYNIHGFMFQACKKFAKSDDIQVLCFKSASELGPYMRVLANMETFSQVKTILIARDADTNVESSIQSIKTALESVENVGLPVPERPFSFVSNSIIRIAFVLFPGPDKKGECQTGEIEDLYLELVCSDGLFKKCVEPFIKCAQLNQENERAKKYLSKHLSKSAIHAYLAGKHDHAGKNLGLVAKCELWNWNDDRLAPFKAIIEQM